MDITIIIGTSGAGLILLAFILNQLNVWKNSSLAYDFVNLLGSVLLVIYATILGTIPFIVLNFVWVVFSIKDVYLGLRVIYQKRKMRTR